MVGFAPRGPQRQVCICNGQMITLVCLFLINFQLTGGFAAMEQTANKVSLRFWTNQILPDGPAGNQRQVFAPFLLATFSLCCHSGHPFLMNSNGLLFQTRMNETQPHCVNVLFFILKSCLYLLSKGFSVWRVLVFSEYPFFWLCTSFFSFAQRFAKAKQSNRLGLLWVLLNCYWHQHGRLLTETQQADMIQFLPGGFKARG